MKIKITKDFGDVYEEGFVMEAKDLISDYKDCLSPNEPNDKEVMDWLDELSDEDALEFIADLWRIEYEVLEN